MNENRGLCGTTLLKWTKFVRFQTMSSHSAEVHERTEVLLRLASISLFEIGQLGGIGIYTKRVEEVGEGEAFSSSFISGKRNQKLA